MSKKSKKKRPAYRDPTYKPPSEKKLIPWDKPPCSHYPTCKKEERGTGDCNRGRLLCCGWKI